MEAMNRSDIYEKRKKKTETWRNKKWHRLLSSSLWIPRKRISASYIFGSLHFDKFLLLSSSHFILFFFIFFSFIIYIFILFQAQVRFSRSSLAYKRSIFLVCAHTFVTVNVIILIDKLSISAMVCYFKKLMNV